MSLTGRRVRRVLLRCHLILAVVLLVSVVLHGQQRLDHDEFFPLADVHDVPCARCHTSSPLLFHVDGSVAEELDSSDVVPSDLHWWFGQHTDGVSETAPVTVKNSGTAWQVKDTDTGTRYDVRKAAERVAVYAENYYESHTCLTCHVHNTEEIQEAHELHGVEDYHRCLVCHQTVIDGQKYGKQRVNWDYDPNW